MEDLTADPTRSDNCYHVFYHPDGTGLDATAILDGFTVSKGQGNGPSPHGNDGGGMFNQNSHPTVTGCIFSSNAVTGSGGGMRNESGSNPAVTNCTFSGNKAIGWAGGMLNHNSNPTVINCTFSGNVSSGGGGMYNYFGSSPTVTNCTFSGNSTSSGGGGMTNHQNCSPTVTNSTFSGNAAYSYGGGMYNYDASPTITNCILWGNTAPAGGEGLYNDFSTPVISYSDIEGCGGSGAGWDTLLGSDGGGNIDSDPKIKDAAGHIWNTSPCKNAGDPAFVVDPNAPVDIDGENRVMDGRVDMGVDELPPSIQNITTGLAYNTIQEAIDDAANDGETIIVQDGTYYTPGPAGIDFGGKEIILRSSDPDDPEIVAATIIDCVNSGSGFNFHTNEDPNSVLDGFTVTNGSGGAAITCDSSSPTIKNCVITGNNAGAITCSSSSPLIKNCVISNNNAGGLSCVVNSHPTIMDSTIKDNDPFGIELDDTSSVIIAGVVEIISNDITGINLGEGALEMESGSSLDTSDCEIYIGTMTGPGTIQIDLGTEVLIDGNSSIDLSDPSDPNNRDLWGTINGEGVLNMADNAEITRAIVNLSQADITDDAKITYSEIHIDDSVPYGQVFADANAIIEDNIIYATGDCYMNLDPSIFAGSFKNNLIYVTITEGVGETRGGLFELRGKPDPEVTGLCDPESESFLCQVVAPNTIPDCNTVTWTIEELRLVEGAKLNLTNRFPFKAPYDSGGDDEVLYVKKLIMGPHSVLNTSYNNVYYENLIIADSYGEEIGQNPSVPFINNSKFINIPLLGFSLINIALNDEIEYIARIIGNNFTHPWDPNYSRTHITRVEGIGPDPAGMMQMYTLEDKDPESLTHEQPINARAKGLFSKSREDEILILFEYLFEVAGSDVELVIYLTDVPELLDHNDPGRSLHYLEVGRLSPPLDGQAGAVGSGRFGTFKRYVDTGDLNFIRGTRMELELVGPDGASVLINNFDPQIHCSASYCGDVSGDTQATAKDFLTVIGSYGGTAGLGPGSSLGTACLDGLFSADGYIDIYDAMSWDWALDGGNPLHLCGVFLDSSMMMSASVSGPAPVTSGFTVGQGSLLVAGKRNSDTDDVKMEDALYALDDQGHYIVADFLTKRTNGKLVKANDNTLYQINLNEGLLRITDSNSVIPSASVTGLNEPRYNQPATVNIGIQYDEGTPYGRPIFDAAFDQSGFVYVVPVVVVPGGTAADPNNIYTAAAKLKLVPGREPPYNILRLYDYPNAASPNDNRNLGMLREIETDDNGSIYVTNGQRYNESDILWKYNSSDGAMQGRLVLNGEPNLPAPIGMCVSNITNTVYLASGQHDPESTSVTVKGFSTDDLTLVRTITINDMGHVTDITEDPASGTLWVVGFKMTNIPEYLSTNAAPFYEPYLAKVLCCDNATVTAFNIAKTSSDPDSDLAMPLSIVWTVAELCGGANLDGIGAVDFADFAILAAQWQQNGTLPANIAPKPMDNIVNIQDLAVIAKYWLDTNCN